MPRLPHSLAGAVLGSRPLPPEENVALFDRPVLVKEGLWIPLLQAQVQAGRALPGELKQELLLAISWQLSCCHALRELSERCAALGIPLVVFKGCTLALCFYTQLGQRVFGDVDIAVPPDQHWRFLEEVRSLGYKVSPCGKILTRCPITLDLHQHPLHQLHQWLAVGDDDWWRDLQLLGDSTGQTLRLGGGHEFVLCLFHGAKHAFSRANWLLDLLVLANRLPLAEIAEVVSLYRAERHLWLANECAHRILGCPFPEAVRALARPPSRWDPLASLLSLICQRRAPEYLGMLTPLWAIRGRWEKVKYLFHLFLPERTAWKQRLRDLSGKFRALLHFGGE